VSVSYWEETTVDKKDSDHDERLLDLARRVLDGDAIGWEREGLDESEVCEGLKRLQRLVGRTDDTGVVGFFHRK
jgi:hypothetical protein